MEPTMDVAPSEDNGNVPAEEVLPVAPSELTSTEAATETAGTVEPVVAEPELIELPDGRKVDSQGVVQEYKNLLTDYTKKAQELAELRKGTLPTETKLANPLADPNYAPQTYEELAAQIEARMEAKSAEREQARIQAEQALENTVSTQLAEIKALDPNVNENALFLHATRYGFRDLKLAHQNQRDMSEAIKKTQTITAANIAKRNDPVSVSPGATGTPLNPDHFATARDYLRALKGQ